jgi:hypothetical protein
MRTTGNRRGSDAEWRFMHISPSRTNAQLPLISFDVPASNELLHDTTLTNNHRKARLPMQSRRVTFSRSHFYENPDVLHENNHALPEEWRQILWG